VTDGRYKLIRFPEEGINDWELYDLKRDPNEMKSVYDSPEMAQVRKRMKKEITLLQDHYGVPEEER
jgi:arylsulfatase A-like enzyme